MAPKPAKKNSIMAKTEDGSPMVEVFSMRTEGDTLVMDCKALDSMRMNVVVKAEDIAKGMPIIKESKGAIIAFAKQLPSAIRAQKRAEKEEAKAARQ